MGNLEDLGREKEFAMEEGLGNRSGLTLRKGCCCHVNESRMIYSRGFLGSWLARSPHGNPFFPSPSFPFFTSTSLTCLGSAKAPSKVS